MENSRRVSLERRNRAELFKNFLSDLILGSNEPGEYAALVGEGLLCLGLALGVRSGLSDWPFAHRPGHEIPLALLEACEPGHLPELYQWSLNFRPVVRRGGVAWTSDNLSRRDAGSYFTPPEFVEKVLASALLSCKPTSGFSVCDPTCGAGAFLLEAAKLLSKRTGGSIDVVLRESIFGCDNDPVAVELCRLMIWLEAGYKIPEGNLICADALSLDWPKTFPDVFERGGFDAVVGNPPFGAVVDGRVPHEAKAMRAQRFPELGGTADFSYYFASLGSRLLKEDGQMGMVLPRAFLSASSSRGLRQLAGYECTLIESCVGHQAFDGAAVHVCLAAFKRSGVGPNVSAVEVREPRSLLVTASLTVSEAYDLAAVIVDKKSGKEPKLLTTGLIDPGSSLWGEVPCRYLKSKYMHPRAPKGSLSPSRLATARKPKLIVAGLSRTIECFLDEHAEYAGSVSTYTITHPKDDERMLRRAMKHLHSAEISARFRSELGSAALGGGNITLTKRFLRQVLAEAGF